MIEQVRLADSPGSSKTIRDRCKDVQVHLEAPADLRRELMSLPGRWRWCDRPWLCDAQKSKRASHIDPPTSSYAIMRRACPYRGENHGPGKDVRRVLTAGPELESCRSEREVNVAYRKDNRPLPGGDPTAEVDP